MKHSLKIGNWKPVLSLPNGLEIVFSGFSRRLLASIIAFLILAPLILIPDEDIDASIKDSSDNNRTGTINNGAWTTGKCRLYMRLMRIFFKQTIGNVQKKKYNQNQGNGNLSNSISSPKISHFLSLLSNQTATNMNTIPRTKFTVNIAKSRKPFGKEIVVPINGTTKKVEEILVQMPDKTFNQGLLNFLLITLVYIFFFPLSNLVFAIKNLIKLGYI